MDNDSSDVEEVVDLGKEVVPNITANSTSSPNTKTSSDKMDVRSQFSHAKILHIIKSAHDFGGASQDAVFLLARATELFLGKMAKDLKAANPNAQKLTYDMLAKMAHSRTEYAFLAKQGILPVRMKYADALERHEQMQRQRRIIEEPFYGLQIETPLRNQAKYAAECARQQNLPQMLKSLYSPPAKSTPASNTPPTAPYSTGGSGASGGSSSGRKQGKKTLPGSSSSGSSKKLDFESAAPPVAASDMDTQERKASGGSDNVVVCIESDEEDCMIVPE